MSMGFFIEKLKNVANINFLDITATSIMLFLLIILTTFLLKTFVVNRIFSIVERLTKKTKTKLDDMLIESLSKPTKSLVTALGIWFAVFILSKQIFSIGVIQNIFSSWILVIIFWGLYRCSEVLVIALNKVLKNSNLNIDEVLMHALKNGIQVSIVVLGVLAFIQEWDYDVGAILTGLGIGGLAFALAAKDTAANLFGSITIMIERSFSIGDWIATPDVEGTVEFVGFRSTKIRTFAQALVLIPNSRLSSVAITNWSRMGKRRITYKLGVTYSTTPEQLKECINRIKQLLKNHPEINKDTIFVTFDSFGDSALEIFLYFFTNTTNWGEFLEIKAEMNFEIMKILSELNIEFAFPSRSIYIENQSKDSVI